MTIPRSGLRARARRGMRGVAALGVAVGLLLASGVAGAPAATASTTEDEDQGSVEVFFSVGAHGAIEYGAALPTTVTVANSTDENLTAGRIMLQLNRTPLPDSAAVDAWLETATAPGSFEDLGTEASTPITASSSGSSAVFVPTSILGDLPVGVYPIRATLSGATTGDVQNDTLTARNATADSVLVVTGETGRQVAVFVPITATPADGALLTADELTDLTSEDGALTAQLDGVSGTSAVLAIDPLIPAAIRALGAAAPPSALAWLTRLATIPNERFALQFGDADATVQAQAGLPALLNATPLTSYLDPLNFVEEEDGATPTPTPSPTPATPALPDDDELTAIRGAVRGMIWPSDDLSTEDLATFATYLDGEATTILPSTAVAGHASTNAAVDGNRVLIANAAASAAFSLAATEPNAMVRAQALTVGTAHLALSGSTGPLLIGLERDETRTADALRETIAAVASDAQPIGLAALLDGDATSVTLDSETSGTRAASLLTLLEDEGELREFGSILTDPRVLLTPERLKILHVIGVGAAASFDDNVAAHRAQTEVTLDAVGIQPPSAIQLFTSAAPLPVWVRNDLPWPITVRLIADPTDARLDVQPTTNVEEAQPASNTRVKVPVEARVGSGELVVRFSLVSPTGIPIGDTQSANVTVRAEWEGIGLGILGGLIALLLVLGVIRTIRQRRREAADADDADAGDANAEPADAGEIDMSTSEKESDD